MRTHDHEFREDFLRHLQKCIICGAEYTCEKVARKPALLAQVNKELHQTKLMVRIDDTWHDITKNVTNVKFTLTGRGA